MAASSLLDADVEPYPGYRLYRFLGRGSFGEVWEGTKPDGTPVALKFLPCASGLRASHEARAVQMVSQLRHPHLVEIDQIWCFEGYVVVSMPLADGTVADLFDSYQAEFGTPIIAEHLWLLLAQAADALDFLNARRHEVNGRRVGIQHGDIKPSNLLVFGEDVRLSDYSLASATSSPLAVHPRAGTLEYTAPEIFQGRLSDWSDQYALAVTYCQLRGGRGPFPDSPATFQTGYVRPAPDLSMLPEAEQPIVRRALAPVPMDRWPTSTEFLRRLQELPPEPVVPVADVARPAARPRRLRLADERRKSARHHCNLRTSWRLLGEQGQQFWAASVVDISSTGLGVHSEQRFNPGTILVVTLDDPEAKSARSLFVRVVRAIEQKQGGWLLGCTFVRKLADADLASLVHAHAGEPAAAE